jgi:hypothetical protein
MNNFIDAYHIPTFLVGAAVVPGRTGGVDDPKKKGKQKIGRKNNR